MVSLDNAIVSFLKDTAIIPTYGPSNRIKIALIGESSPEKTKDTLAYKIHKEFNIQLRKISVFTVSKKFKVSDGERHDVLIGVRPCGADELILKAVEKYNKRFLLVPCTCGGYGGKVLRLIRKYPVITICSARSPEYSAGKNRTTYDKRGWIILYNTSYDVAQKTNKEEEK